MSGREALIKLLLDLIAQLGRHRVPSQWFLPFVQDRPVGEARAELVIHLPDHALKVMRHAIKRRNHYAIQMGKKRTVKC